MVQKTMETKRRHCTARVALANRISLKWSCSVVIQAANEIYERKLDVDNEQTEQVDEKRKRVPELPEVFSGFLPFE